MTTDTEKFLVVVAYNERHSGNEDVLPGDSRQRAFHGPFDSRKDALRWAQACLVAPDIATVNICPLKSAA